MNTPGLFLMNVEHIPGLKYRLSTVNRFVGTLLFILLISVGFSDLVYSQVEDTTSTGRTGPPESEERGYNNYYNTQFQHRISNDDVNRYSLFGIDGRYTFHGRLGTQNIDEFMLSAEDRYNPYGPDWELKINEQLSAILSETFKEHNSFLQKLARIAPFLGFGFFEEYRVPVVPRMSDTEPEKPTPDQ